MSGARLTYQRDQPSLRSQLVSYRPDLIEDDILTNNSVKHGFYTIFHQTTSTRSYQTRLIIDHNNKELVIKKMQKFLFRQLRVKMF